MPRLLRRTLLRASAAGAMLHGLGSGHAEGQPTALGAAALKLGFEGPALPPGVTLARASAALGSGMGDELRAAAPGQPRFERDAATGRPLGLLIEGETTNLLTSGGDFTRWRTPGSVSVRREPDVVAPDGSRGAYRVRPGGITKFDQGLLHWTGPPTGEGFMTASVWLRTPPGAGEMRWAIACFDFATYRNHRTVATVGERWTRVATSFPWYAFDRGSKVVNLAAPLGDAPADREILLWGPQYERTRFATTLAPAAEPGLRRRADEVHADLSSLAGAEGTIALVLPAGAAPGGVLLDAGDLMLALDDNGRIEARAGRLALAGLGDATGDTRFELAWWPGGAAVRSGREGATIVRARATGEAGSVAPAKRSRLLGDEAGGRPANTHLLGLEGWRRARPADAPEAPVYVPRLYTLAFADDFDDADVARINENAVPGAGKAPAWRSRYRHDRFTIINKEKQIYVDRDFRGTGPTPLGVQPFAIRDSVLTIAAERADPERVRPALKNAAYTSGCITTEFTFWQQHGYFEIRCRCPLGKGFWPAFWLLPKRVAWPPELDPLEASGERRWSFHQGSVGDKTHPPKWIDGWVDITSGFHVYAVEWTERDIIFSINGRETFRQPNFANEPMYLLANLALGSKDPKWIPDPDETTPFPGRFEIDWIRAWRRGA